MPPAVFAAPTMDRLTDFVHKALCESDALDPRQALLRHVVVSRRGRPCALLFDVEGPRLLRTSAVWAADEDRVLFYDSTGRRTAEVALSESPPLEG